MIRLFLGLFLVGNLAAQVVSVDNESMPTARVKINSNFSYLDANKQGLDADLTALAALAATAGIVKRTGAGAFALATAGTDYVIPAGNVATATALAVNPTGCDAGEFVTDTAADGTLTCDTPTGTGDVSGPVSSTDQTVARFVSTGGDEIEGSGVVIDDSDNVTIPGNLIVEGTITVGDGTVAGELTAGELTANGANYISWLAPDTITNTLRLKFPNADPAAGQVLAFGPPTANVSVGSWFTVGRKFVQLVVFGFATTTATGDGKYYFDVPSELNGMNLVAVSGKVIAVGTTGTINIDLARCAVVATGAPCSGTVSDMLSTNLTIDSNEEKSSTAASAAVIDTANDDVSTLQTVRVDVDAVHTTPATGLILTLEFQLP
jgi:hypothetical protein